MNQVILYLTDKLNETNIEIFTKLKNDINGKYDLIILYHKKDDEVLSEELFKDNFFIFTDEDIFEKLGYTPIVEKSVVPGSAHFPIFYFMKNYHKRYDYYWRIENDVYFNGNWMELIEDFNNNSIDFITGKIDAINSKNSSWPWFNYKTHNLKIEKTIFIKSFTPVMRISYNALNFLDTKYSNGVTGHFELTIPTLLHHNGFKIGDYGGSGILTIRGYKNKYYIDNDEINTLRWRPVYYDKNEFTLENKIYHPYKHKDDKNWETEE